MCLAFVVLRDDDALLAFHTALPLPWHLFTHCHLRWSRALRIPVHWVLLHSFCLLPTRKRSLTPRCRLQRPPPPPPPPSTATRTITAPVFSGRTCPPWLPRHPARAAQRPPCHGPQAPRAPCEWCPQPRCLTATRTRPPPLRWAPLPQPRLLRPTPRIRHRVPGAVLWPRHHQPQRQRRRGMPPGGPLRRPTRPPLPPPLPLLPLIQRQRELPSRGPVRQPRRLHLRRHRRQRRPVPQA